MRSHCQAAEEKLVVERREETTSSVATVVLYVAIRCTSDEGCASDELSIPNFVEAIIIYWAPRPRRPNKNFRRERGER